jgi:hypothetical protein
MHASPTATVNEGVRVLAHAFMLPIACSTDQSLTEVCKFTAVKNSQGECYKRGEGPPTPGLQATPPHVPHGL